MRRSLRGFAASDARAPGRLRAFGRVPLVRSAILVCVALRFATANAAFFVAEATDQPEVEILSQQFSYSQGEKPDVAIAIEGTEISGSQIYRRQAAAAAKPKAMPPVAPSVTKPAPSVTPPTKKTPKPTATPTVRPKRASQTSALWPYELADELTQQELMTILVAIVSGFGLVGLVATALWYLVWFAWLTMREQKLLALVFARQTSAQELEKLVEQSGHALPLLLRPIAASQLRLLQLLEVVDKLVETTAKISFDDAAMVIHGLPPAPSENGQMKDERMTFFHILSAIESLQCHGESIAVELTALVVPTRWKRHVDLTRSVDELKKRMLALRQRHAEIQELHKRVVEALERHHVNSDVIDQHKLVRLVAALRQTPPAAKPAKAETTQLASPLKLRNPTEGKDEFGFFLRSFDELNRQKQVQTELEQAFTKLSASMVTSRVSPLNVEVEVKKEEKVVEVKKEAKKTDSKKSKAPPPADAASAPSITTSTTSTTVTAHIDGTLTRTLESWVDKADEMEVTHLDEVKRAQYMLEEAKRESFCLLNSSRDAMQSVESLKASLVSLGADPKAAVLTAAEIYSSRSNMLMLTTTLRSVFDEFRKGDMIKMEDRRRRHAQKERDKRERIVAKFRLKQHLMHEKVELQRALEREQQERERTRREREELDAFIKQTKADRKRFVWTITKLDVFIVLMVMAIVFFDSLTRQFNLLKPSCAIAGAASPSSSMLGFSSVMSSSWWPTNSLSLLQCRLEYAVKVAGLFLAGGASFYIIAQLNLLTTALPVVIAAGLYHLRTEWMNMLFRLPVLLVLYGFNTMVLYLLNQSLSEDDPKQPTKAKRRALLLYVAFPVVSVLLSVVVSIIIACDHPHECVVTAITVSRRSFASLWQVARQAYHL